MMTVGSALSFIAEYFVGRMLDKIIDHKTVAEGLKAAYNKCAAPFISEGDGGRYHFSQSQTAEQGTLNLFLMPESYVIRDLVRDLRKTDNLLEFSDEDVFTFVGSIEAECWKSSDLMPLMAYRQSAQIMKVVNSLSRTDDLMTPEAFRTAYNKSVYKLATDLNNRFVGRDEEIRRFMEHMGEENAVMIISGRQGTGKTRFALEACSAYAARSGYAVVCLSSMASDVGTTLRRYLDRCPETIIFVDDVNHLSGSPDTVLSLLRHYDSLKIVCTVRDYALEGIRKHFRPFRHEIMALGCLAESEQKEIITTLSNRRLSKTEVDRIIEKSRSNIRMAAMMVRKMNEGMSLDNIEEVSQLMDCYYLPVIELVEESMGRNALKVLAAISFHRVVSRDDRNTRQIYDFTGVQENEFWHLAESLHKLEIVDMFEKEVVKFSDQQLMAYTFYNIFIDRKILPFADLVADNIDEYRITRLRNTFDSVETVWDRKCVDQCRDILRGRSDSLDDNEKLLYYSVFWKVFPEDAFIYYASLVSPDAAERTDFSDTPDLYLHAFSVETPTNILAMMAGRWPDKKKLYYRLMVRLVRFGVLYYPYLEEAFQDFEINMHDDGTSAFERRCAFLDFLHEELSAKPSDLTVGRFVLEHWNHLLWVPEDCDDEKVSSKVWGLLCLFPEDKYPDLRKSLAGCHVDSYVDLELFDRIFDYTDFAQCYQIWKCLRYSKGISKPVFARFRSPLWPLFMKLHDKKGGLPRGDDLHIANQILRIREAIAEVDEEWQEYNEEYMLKVLLGRSRNRYLKVLGFFLSRCPLNIRPYVMVGYLAAYKSEEDFRAFMDVLESSLSGQILCYHKIMAYACLDAGLVSEERLMTALNIFRTCDFSRMSLFYVLMLVDTYEHVMPREKLWNIILDDIHHKIMVGEEIEFSVACFGKLAVMTDEAHMEALMDVLHYMEEHSFGGSLSDDFYAFVLERRPEFFRTLFRHRTSGPNKIYRCNFIWKLPNVKEIIKSVITSSEFRWTISKIEYSISGSPEEYMILKELLAEMADDPHAVRVIFTIVANRFRSMIPDLAVCLVAHNNDVELFKSVRLTPDHYTYHGSFMPILNGEIGTLTDVRDALMSSDPLPTAHIAHLNHRISLSESYKRDILKREFAEV